MGGVYGTAEGAYQSIMRTAASSDKIRVRVREVLTETVRSPVVLQEFLASSRTKTCSNPKNFRARIWERVVFMAHWRVLTSQ